MRRHTSLAAMSQDILEGCTEKVSGETWNERLQTVEDAIDKMYEALDDQYASGSREFSNEIIVTAVLDRLDVSTVTDPDQAKLFAMSTNLDHQIASFDWLIEQALSLTEDIPESPFPSTSATVH